MATFVKRKGPGGRLVWQARVRKRGSPQRTRTFSLKAHAEAWTRRVEREMEAGTFVSRAEAESTTWRSKASRFS